MNIYLIENTSKTDGKDIERITSSNKKYEIFIKQKLQNSTLISLTYNNCEYKFRNFGFSPNGIITYLNLGKIICVIDVNSRILILNYDEGKCVGELVIDIITTKEIEKFIINDKRNIIQKAFSRISFLEILKEGESIHISDDIKIILLFSSNYEFNLELSSKIIIFIKNYIDDYNHIYGDWFELKIENLIDFYNFNLNKQIYYSQNQVNIKSIFINKNNDPIREKNEINLSQIKEVNYKTNFSINFFNEKKENIDHFQIISVYFSQKEEKYNILTIINSKVEFLKNYLNSSTNKYIPKVEFVYSDEIYLKTKIYYDSTEILTKLSTNLGFLCICMSFKYKTISYELVVYDLSLKIFKSKSISLNDFGLIDTNLQLVDLYFSENQFILNFSFRYLIFFDCYSMDIIYITNDQGIFSPILKGDLSNGLKYDKILFSWFSNSKENLNKTLFIINKKNQFKINFTRKLLNKRNINFFLEDEFQFLNNLSIYIYDKES